jgi:sec-independent protein translocase protein TatA
MLPLAFLQNIGLPELIVIMVIALLIFGHKLPSVARSLGSSVNEFKKGAREGEEEANKAATAQQAAPPAAPAEKK